MQKIFRDRWDRRLRNWTDLEESIRSKVASQIRSFITEQVPEDPDERKSFDQKIDTLINLCWTKSWDNMKHSSREKKKKIRRSRNEPKGMDLIRNEKKIT